jgi:hypothetical protein
MYNKLKTVVERNIFFLSIYRSIQVVCGHDGQVIFFFSQYTYSTVNTVIYSNKILSHEVS